MHFPTQDRVFTLALLNETSFSLRNRREHFILDVFPSRIRPNPGYTAEDAVLALLADLHTPHQDQWGVPAGTPWLSFSQTHPTWDHPVASLWPGAVACARATEDAHIPDEAILVLLEDGYVTVGRHRYARDTFSPTPFVRDDTLHKGRLHAALTQRPEVAAVALGGIDRILETQAAPDLDDILIPLMAWLELITTGPAPLTGKAALQAGRNYASNLAFALQALWIVRPNQIIGATHLVPGPQWERLAARHRGSPQWEAGRAGMDAIRAAPFQGLELAGLLTPPVSAHEKIALKAAQRALDTALLTALPEAALKPMAAARARRARAR